MMARRIVGGSKRVLLHSLTFVSLGSMLFVVSACRSAGAQEIIHARAGQVVAISPKARTLTLKTADGSAVVFKEVTGPEPAMSFDKDVRSKTVAANTFNTVGAYVLVFYFGFDTPTAVAVEDLGKTGPQRTIGSVDHFDRHQHLLMLNAGAAEPQKVVVSDDTIVDTPEGVVKAVDFHPSRGEQLRCFTRPESMTALFVAPN